jgi:hypothetical protein
MARTAEETASILTILYGEQFNQESYEPFRITWPQLRFLADIPLLSDMYLKDVNNELSKTDYNLTTCGNFLVVAMDQDLANYRTLPDRLLEKCLYEIENVELGDDDLEDEDEDEDEQGEVDDDQSDDDVADVNVED